MTVYFLLLSVTAFFAYVIGSIRTTRLAGRYLFRRNLHSLGRGSVWLSNFRRIYGIPGFLKLALAEFVRDLIPVVIGGVLLGFKGHADVGRAFAGFCLVLACQLPLFNRFRGSNGIVPLIVVCLILRPAIGIAGLAVCVLGILLSRYISLGAVAAAVITIITAVLLLDDRMTLALLVGAAALVILWSIPSLFRISQGREERLSFQEDLSYKLDQRF